MILLRCSQHGHHMTCMGGSGLLVLCLVFIAYISFLVISKP